MNDIKNVSADVVTLLNGHSFTQTFTAARHYNPRVATKEIGSEVTVYVVPNRLDTSLKTRALRQKEVSVWVAIMKRFAAGGGGNTEIDGLMALVEEVDEYLALPANRELSSGVWIGSVIDPIYGTSEMEMGVFASMILATYRLYGV